MYLCTPYDAPSVDILDAMHVTAFKIASTDTTNVPLLRYMAGKKRPVILSTGMSSLAEVEDAVTALRSGGLERQIILLHCLAEYPAPVGETNLRAMATMRHAFGCPVGFSDHTAGIGVTPWAVALGACAIEKHLTLDRTMSGPDHRASLEPDEMAALVRAVRDVEAALGDGIKRPMPSELVNKPVMQKSLVARRSIKAGERIEAADLTCKRPATGLSPRDIDIVIGRRAARPIAAGETILRSAVDWDS
jgi:sialic acid synthase SpsE